jgi:UDP-glucuronate decarboxylase
MERKGTRTAVVAGGAGFIGSHICGLLFRRGYRVVCVDNFLTGSLDNLADLLGRPGFELLRHDIVDPLDLPGEVHEIYNFACAASPPLYQRDPVHTMKTSVLGSINLLELARRTKARILQASTSEVYGDPERHPQPETYWGNVNPIGPRACYDEGKRAAEALFFDHHRLYGVPIRVARIFNTYGPHMSPNDGRIVSTFVSQALAGRPLTVYGDGRQTRSLCYIDDLVRGLDLLMQSDEDLRVPVNLGNPCELPVIAIAERVLALTGASSTIEFRPMPEDDPRRRRPVVDRARTLLGWAPQVDLDSGLARTIEFLAPRILGGRAKAIRFRRPARSRVGNLAARATLPV